MKVAAPNYTQTPNDLFDHWLPHLSEGELKVLLVIIRKTFGWHRTQDVISVSQLTKITGMHEETVVRSAKSLQSKGVISRKVIGPVGKQITIYSLVIEGKGTFSNNSYPSDEPGGPLGSDGPVSSEAQKKPSIKETNIKEQQQAKPVSFAAVVPLASPKKKNEKPLIWPELESIDIAVDQKKEITRDYSREKVQHGVKYVTHPKTVITKGLLQALKWACRVQPELPIDKTPREEMNKAYAMKYDGKQVGGAIITACNKHIELVNGPLVFALTYDSKDFMDKFTEQLRKNRIPILEA